MVSSSSSSSYSRYAVKAIVLLLILIFASACIWGVYHEQRDLQTRSVSALHKAGFNMSHFTVEFSGRDGRLDAGSTDRDTLLRAAEVMESVQGVRKVVYRNALADTILKSEVGSKSPPSTKPFPAGQEQSTGPVVEMTSARNPNTDDRKVQDNAVSLEPGKPDLNIGVGQLLLELSERNTLRFIPGSPWWTLETGKSLRDVAIVLKTHPDTNLEIGGFSENIGNGPFRMYLSQIRANNVKTYLVYQGVDPSQLVTRGYGYQPIVTADQNEAKTSRGVGFSIIGGG